MLNGTVHQGTMAVVWLAAVLLLILAAARAARLVPARFRRPGLQAGPAEANGLTMRGSLALDLRRRLYLVEAGGQPTLILTGGTADLMIALQPPQA